MKDPSSPPIELPTRRMTPADVPQVAEIERRSFKDPWPADFFQRCMVSGCDCWVLEAGSEIQAYAILQADQYAAHLLNICVSPKRRRRGLGKLLLEFLINQLRDISPFMVLEVRASNQGAIKMYEGLGFQQIGVRKNYYRDPQAREDALVFARRLEKG